MLYALSHPFSLFVLLVSYVLGLTLSGWVQSVVAARLGERQLSYEGRTHPDPRRQLNPYAWIAAAVSGLGWVKEVPFGDRRRRAALVAVALVGPALNIVLGVGLLIAARAAGPLIPTNPAVLLSRGFVGTSSSAVLVTVGCSQLYLGVLALVPLPPLSGGTLLLGLAPHTLGWQKARHYLVEQNLGLVATLVLLVLPLGGGLPLLPTVLDEILSPLVTAVLGG